MAKKILIVDDEQKFRDKFASLARQSGLEIILADGVKSGIKMALECRPDAIITDKDMKDGTGNDLAKAVKKAYSVNIAGITGGDPKEFDSKYVDVRLPKTITDQDYQTLVKIIVDSKDPRKDFNSAVGICYGGLTDAFNPLMDAYLLPIDILVQGYLMGAQLRRGEKPVENVELNIPTEEQMVNLMDIKKVGIDSKALKEKMIDLETAIDSALSDGPERKLQISAMEFVGDKKIRGFMKNLIDGKYDKIDEDQCKAYHAVFEKMFNAYSKIYSEEH